MRRMKNAFASQAPWGPSLGGWSAGERSLVFHRALIFRAGSLSCCRMPEPGFALQTLFMLLLCVRSQGCRVEQGVPLSSHGLECTGTHQMGLKGDSRYHRKVLRLPGSQVVPLLLYSQGVLPINQACGASLPEMSSTGIILQFEESEAQRE